MIHRFKLGVIWWLWGRVAAVNAYFAEAYVKEQRKTPVTGRLGE